MNNWTNEELLDQIITKANQISIISESNDLMDMKNELLNRFKKIKYRDCKALIFMAEPNKGEPHSYKYIENDIDEWAKLYGYEIFGDR